MCVAHLDGYVAHTLLIVVLNNSCIIYGVSHTWMGVSHTFTIVKSVSHTWMDVSHTIKYRLAKFLRCVRARRKGRRDVCATCRTLCATCRTLKKSDDTLFWENTHN